ncbi:MAG: hypothetical protein IGQ45_03825 [Cyanobacterium sp. T60_A2020_053]|nr:hypothetical protein [Cyanobacterium sp. T60_A2020_053]
MSKPFYRNKITGNYGVLEGLVISNQAGMGSSSLHQLRLVKAVGGMVEPSDKQESVVAENLVEVSREEVEKALLPFN